MHGLVIPLVCGAMTGTKKISTASGTGSDVGSEGKIDIRHLSELAQLRLSAEEQRAVSADLARIIGMVDQMQSLDTDGVTPLAHPLDAHARLRPDEITESVDRERYQASAPATEDGFYLVPRVVE